MLKQTYGYIIFEHRACYTDGSRAVSDRIFFTVTGRDADELYQAALRKIDEVEYGLKWNQYLDDIVWDEPREAGPDWEEA